VHVINVVCPGLNAWCAEVTCLLYFADCFGKVLMCVRPGGVLSIVVTI